MTRRSTPHLASLMNQLGKPDHDARSAAWERVLEASSMATAAATEARYMWGHVAHRRHLLDQSLTPSRRARLEADLVEDLADAETADARAYETVVAYLDAWDAYEAITVEEAL